MGVFPSEGVPGAENFLFTMLVGAIIIVVSYYSAGGNESYHLANMHGWTSKPLFLQCSRRLVVTVVVMLFHSLFTLRRVVSVMFNPI